MALLWPTCLARRWKIRSCNKRNHNLWPECYGLKASTLTPYGHVKKFFSSFFLSSSKEFFQEKPSNSMRYLGHKNRGNIRKRRLEFHDVFSRLPRGPRSWSLFPLSCPNSETARKIHNRRFRMLRCKSIKKINNFLPFLKMKEAAFN